MQQHISLFRNAQSTEPTTVQLGAFLSSKRHIQQIEAIRAEQDKKLRDELKKQLPAATVSGTFSRRAIAGLTAYNGLVCLDFDGKDNPDLSPSEIKERLAGFEEVAYAGLSVSGSGVFAIVPTDNTDPAQHARVVEILGRVMAHHGLTIDKACKDVCRLRFVSYDDAAFVNPKAAPFQARRILDALAAKEEVKRPRPLIVRQESDDETRNRVEELLEQVEAKRADLTQDYESWVKMGMALASHFGIEGEDYYQRLSAFHPKYNQLETAKKYHNIIKTGRNNVKIGTFFKLVRAAL